MTTDLEYLTIATKLSEAGRCQRRRVGAVLVRDGEILAKGVNQTPDGIADCIDGGCARCADPTIGKGENRDLCVCVHAEMITLTSAARDGISTENSTLYVTYQPCAICSKALIQFGVKRVLYQIPWHPEGAGTTDDYQSLQAALNSEQIHFANVPTR